MSGAPSPIPFRLRLSIGGRNVGESVGPLLDTRPAEYQTVNPLVDTESLQQAPSSLHTRIRTRRKQLKPTFGKTERRSQSQLLLLATRVAPLFLFQLADAETRAQL